MPLKNYGVLKGRAVKGVLGEKSNPHYQVLMTDGQVSYRIAVNVQSKLSPSELLYLVDDDFAHPITKGLVKLGDGFNELDRKPAGLALDFIRGNLFDVTKMKPLPFNVPGPENDLNELIELYIQRAIASEQATLYAFGERWGPEEDTPDKIFHFRPGNGIHDIHMNQGNSKQFAKDDGVWQDGGLLIHFPTRNEWVGVFLAFQSQVFHTDDKTGHRLDDKDTGHPINSGIPKSDGTVRIVAALVNPPGDDPSKETVTLLNTSAERVDLSGWALADSLKRKHPLNEISLESGALVTVPLTGDDIQLGNDGGIITLLNQEGIKIDGVSYTKEAANKQGWTVVF